MSEQENEALSRRFYEIINEENLDALDEVIAANYVGHQPGDEVLNGPDGFKQLISTYRAAFPDLRFTIEELIASGDQVVTRWTTTGTHRGELQGIAATGKQITGSGIGLARIEGGQIVEDWMQWDRLDLMQQIGAIPAPAEA